MAASSTNRDYTLRGTGLTKKDLEESVIVALGFCPGELLPPYFGRVSKEAARRVLNYILNAISFRTYLIAFVYTKDIVSFGTEGIAFMYTKALIIVRIFNAFSISTRRTRRGER